jgi:antitoxin YefM
MALTVPFAEARRRFSELLTRVAKRNEHVVITRNGEPDAVLISADEYEAIVESLELLDDDETLAALAESERDSRAGRVMTLDQVKRKLKR